MSTDCVSSCADPITINIEDRSEHDKTTTMTGASSYSITPTTPNSTLDLLNPDSLSKPRPSIASTILTSYENDRYTAIIREVIRSDSLISGGRSSLNSFHSNRTNSSLTPPVVINELGCNGQPRLLGAQRSVDSDCEVAQAMHTLLAAQCSQQIGEERKTSIPVCCNNVGHDRRYYWNKVRDYAYRTHRFAMAVCIFLVSLVTYTSLSYAYYGLLSPKLSVVVLLCAIGTTIFFMSLSTFRRWFYYWDPEFSFSRPS